MELTEDRRKLATLSDVHTSFYRGICEGAGRLAGVPGMTMADASAASLGTSDAQRAPVPRGNVPSLRCVTPSPKENNRNGRRNAVGDESPDGGAVGASTADDNGIARARRKRWGRW